MIKEMILTESELARAACEYVERNRTIDAECTARVRFMVEKVGGKAKVSAHLEMVPKGIE
jgi:hypothetical protein